MNIEDLSMFLSVRPMVSIIFILLNQMELIRLPWDQINFEKKVVILDNQNPITQVKKIATFH
jgi:hypothetical protein